MSSTNGLKLNDKLQEAYNKAIGSGLRFTSGFRAGSVGPKGKPDSHSQGMAMDFAGNPAQMAVFAEWAKKSGLFTEVLYKTAGHYDHVHVGWQEGKHQAGKVYVGDGTLIDRVGGGASGNLQTVGDTSAPAGGGDKAGFVSSLFNGIFRVLMIVICLIGGVYFFMNAFPQMKQLIK
ncbi:Peptidase M15 [Streptococcus pneumoniae]|uniref:D-Ala-D-Ala carboxypeptidase family metallohydrolase n=1 Tax=Bacilli TaxID=91061 RepID=UPI0005DB1B49|nr:MULTISPECIES: D-Ala-D-Ala carboxypeptidase family metallohydrolase [Bacilli]CKE75869.1 Peptidase M15 [Streptococcus pneumoniae]CKE78449.1 Peptidase M15 [Streptococcus pneumoniae]CKE88046.1 Peptidase M15 [Streptococcus pneumoniae]CKF08445.1 Peptidase M15 [Streptococcus pneumoniae]CKF17390.1 Peptidase M15 [Streptococcus pneumoniae]